MKSFAEELRILERCTLGRWRVKGSNQGISHFINVVFKPRRTTAGKHVVYLLQRPSAVNQVTDPETRKNIVRQKGWCFGCLKTSHIIFFMWKCNVEQRLTMSMRTKNSRLRRMEKNCPFEDQAALPTGPFLFLRQEFVPFNGRPRLVTHLF